MASTPGVRVPDYQLALAGKQRVLGFHPRRRTYREAIIRAFYAGVECKPHDSGDRVDRVYSAGVPRAWSNHDGYGSHG